MAGMDTELMPVPEPDDKGRHLLKRGTNELTERGHEVCRLSLELAGEGFTHKELAEEIGISVNALVRLRRRFPAFRDELEQAMFDASSLHVEEIKEVPYIEADAARARVKIEALTRYLELRWPDRYGKRVNMQVKTMDMTRALAEARRRQSQVIDATAKVVEYPTDDYQSDAAEGAGIADLLE